MGDKAATPGAPGLRDDAGGGENNPPFLKLPPELRTIIYRYAAVNDSPIRLYLSDVNCRPRPQTREYGRHPLTINLKPHPHPLALACRTFYREARPIYLVENTFCLSNLTTTVNLHVEYVKQFRKVMGPFAKHLNKVNVDYRFCALIEDGGSTDQRWVRLIILLYVDA
ncbi:hypothetical protein KC345_g474 [Hortaea werneckii]|nr:hypothetical protein KC345_g474 [Hortaea werneckii]